MTLRVVQICPIKAQRDLAIAEKLTLWPTIADVAAAVAAAGAEVTLMLDGPAEDLAREGVRYRQIPGLARIRWNRPLSPPAVHFVREHRPDVIHLVGLELPVLARALCGVGIPVFAQDHASRPKRRAAPLWRWGNACLDGVAFTAVAQAEPFHQSRQLPASARLFAIPESSSRFTPGSQTAARAQTGIHGAPALLWVGHLNANKDPLTVLRAMQRLMPHLPQARLWCAFGEAPLRREVKALLDEDRELASRVHLLGRVPHARMELLYRAADAFVGASRREGSGYALIEALACGLPTIVSDIPSFRELTGGGSTGALIPVGDPVAMADAILREFANSPQRADARGCAIRRHFDAHLSFAVIGARLVEAYTALARGRVPCA